MQPSFFLQEAKRKPAKQTTQSQKQITDLEKIISQLETKIENIKKEGEIVIETGLDFDDTVKIDNEESNCV